MKRYVLVLQAGLFITLSSSNAFSQTLHEHVAWCLRSDSANQSMAQQAAPFPRATCKEFLVGGLMAGISPYILGGISQRDWSQKALPLSCSPDPANHVLAAGLIAACQCHHDNLARDILSNPFPTIALLQSEAGCFVSR